MVIQLATKGEWQLLKYINLEYHPSDSRIRIVDVDVSQTLNSRMGTGGGNVPLILEIHEQITRNDSGSPDTENQ